MRGATESGLGDRQANVDDVAPLPLLAGLTQELVGAYAQASAGFDDRKDQGPKLIAPIGLTEETDLSPDYIVGPE